MTERRRQNKVEGRPMIGFCKLGNFKELNKRKINYRCYLCQNSFNINTSHIVKFDSFIVEKDILHFLAQFPTKYILKKGNKCGENICEIKCFIYVYIP